MDSIRQAGRLITSSLEEQEVSLNTVLKQKGDPRARQVPEEGYSAEAQSKVEADGWTKHLKDEQRSATTRVSRSWTTPERACVPATTTGSQFQVTFFNRSVVTLSEPTSQRGAEMAKRTVIVRTINEDTQYVYKKKGAGEARVIAFLALIGHVVNTAIRKILVPIIMAFTYQLQSDDNKALVKDEWKRLMPLKAILGLVVHPVLDTLGIFFGDRLNKLSGDFERWIVGDDVNARYSSRIGKGLAIARGTNACCAVVLGRYTTPCQQPVFVLSNQRLSINLTSKGYGEHHLGHKVQTSDRAAFIRFVMTGHSQIKIQHQVHSAIVEEV